MQIRNKKKNQIQYNERPLRLRAYIRSHEYCHIKQPFG